MLTLTHECNLSCRYCYEVNKSRSVMPVSVARNTIEKHFKNSEAFDEIEISFHGGEPLLQFDTIRSLCEWMWSQSWSKPFIIYATTNGTLAHGEIQNWAARNKDRFCLGLSLDGTEEMHNTNRSNSFNRIDLKFFQKTWPEQAVKMTVSDLTLPNVAEGIIYLHQLGFKIEGGFAYGLDWSSKKTLEILAAQLEKLADYYLLNPAITPCSFINMELSVVGMMGSPEGEDLAMSEERHSKKWCGIGTELFAVDVDGTEYPCHLFLPFASGRKTPAFANFDFSDLGQLLDTRCEDCVIHPICPTCYASNLLETGSPATRNSSFCTLHKLRALASSNMQARMILRRSEFSKFNQMEPDELLLTIMGIESIQSSIRL